LIGRLCSSLELVNAHVTEVEAAKAYACEVLGHLGHALTPMSLTTAEFITLLARTLDALRHRGPFDEPPADLLEAKRAAAVALGTVRDSARASSTNDEYYRKAIGDRAQLKAREARAIEQERYLKTREEAVKRLGERVQEREVRVRAEERKHEGYEADASIRIRVLSRQVYRLEKEVLELNREIATMEVTRDVENANDDNHRIDDEDEDEDEEDLGGGADRDHRRPPGVPAHQW
jgi:hypothetical protein